MKRLLLAFFLLSCSLAASEAAAQEAASSPPGDSAPEVAEVQAPKSEMNFSLVVGSRKLTDGAVWGTMDTHSAVGLEVDFAQEQWPINIVAGWNTSASSEYSIGSAFFAIKETAYMSEPYIGLRKWIGKDSPVSAYLSAGVALTTVTVKVSYATIGGFGSASPSTSSLGGFVDGGAVIRSGFLFVGIQGRAALGTKGSMTVYQSDLNGSADYWQVGLVLGISLRR